MWPTGTIVCGLMGILVGFLMPVMRPGPSQMETIVEFAILGAIFGLAIDLLGASVVSYMTRDHTHNLDPNVTAAPHDGAMGRPQFQFTTRSILKWMGVFALVVGVPLALYRYLDDMVMNIERDAARTRVLERGSDTEYDRQLLGDELDSLKAERARRLSARTP